MENQILYPSYSAQEARQFFSVVVQQVQQSLSSQLVILKTALPEGTDKYETKRKTLLGFVPAKELLRLAVYKSTPVEVRQLVQAVCQSNLGLVRAVLFPLVHEFFGFEQDTRLIYHRGQREYTTSSELAWDAILECLLDDLQLARALFTCSVSSHYDIPEFLNSFRAFALTDSHGFQGRLDLQYQREDSLPDDVDRDLSLASQQFGTNPNESDSDHTNNHANHADSDLTAIKHELFSRLADRFPIAGVKLTANSAQKITELYLTGMAQCADHLADPQSAWGRLRLPRGYVKDSVCPALGIATHQENLLRKVFEQVLASLHSSA